MTEFMSELDGSRPSHPQTREVRGRVRAGETDIGLGGVEVTWLAESPDADTMVEFGRAVTAEDGSFAIELSEEPEAEAAFCLSRHRPQSISFLTVSDTDLRVPADHSPEGVLLRLEAGGTSPEDGAWRQLADYLSANRLPRMADVARELESPSPDSPVLAWTTRARTAAVQLIASYSSGPVGEARFDAKHFVHLGDLAQGDVASAVTRFSDIEASGRDLVWADLWHRIGVHTSDTELYRDYLRGVWVTAAQQMHQHLASQAPGAPLSPPPAAALLERQLSGRFHQDFRTSDDAKQPRATLLVELLRAVLLADKNREGFGLFAADLPVQTSTESDEQFVALLVAASGVSTLELRNRFRVDFGRELTETVSPVDLSVEALLGLLDDTWQSPEEHFPAVPPIAEHKKPLVFTPYLGRAAFHLEYDEWLVRQRAFYPENVYDIRRNLVGFDAIFRKELEQLQTDANAPNFGELDYVNTTKERQDSARWIASIVGTVDAMRASLTAADLRDYPKANDLLGDAEARLTRAFKDAQFSWFRDTFNYWLEYSNTWNDDRAVSLIKRAARPVDNRGQLAAFESWFDAPSLGRSTNDPSQKGREADYQIGRSQLMRSRTLYAWWIYYAHQVLLPYLRSQIASATSDHAGALRDLGPLTGYLVGVAETTVTTAYRPSDPTSKPWPRLMTDSTLPYTTAVAFDQSGYVESPSAFPAPPGYLVFYDRVAIAPFEKRFFELAQGEVMLAWADELYRSDDTASRARARELFKGVLFLHGADAEIAPQFGRRLWHPGLIPGYEFQENPALVSQVRRARLALLQLELGLNVYGYHPDMVPVLRFETLKRAADLFAASAKSTQSDFLSYTVRFEQARIESWQADTAVKKAAASLSIAAEQIQIAADGVSKAEKQVKAVEARIAAKQKEIDDHNSFFAQAKDWFGGMKDSLQGLAKDFGDSYAASSGTASASGATSGTAASGPSGSASSMMAGGGVIAAYGAFAYYGYTTMSSMADAAAQRGADLKNLTGEAITGAKAQVAVMQRVVTIANLQKSIAEADLELATELRRFEQDRFLNVDLWNKLATLAQRTMRRYIDLGARAGWMAERALEFQENREIDIIGLSYFPAGLRGVTGADRLQLDLAELEANRLQGLARSVPVKHTVSLASSFPIQFGQLKKRGRTFFSTWEATLREAFPGTYGYRVRAVTASAVDSQGRAPVGILHNLGVSSVAPSPDGTPRVLIRFPDGFPLSEFRLREDQEVFGFPGERLMPFEGSGIQTAWELEFPPGANRRGLDTLTDVLLTFDLNASYAPPPPTTSPLPVTGAIALSGRVADPAGFAKLQGPKDPVAVSFDLAALPRRAGESHRTIANLAVLLIGDSKKPVHAVLSSAAGGANAPHLVVDGVAMSNAGPLLGTGSPLPLNALVGETADQVLTLKLTTEGVNVQMKALLDVVLVVEYAADL